MFYMSLYRGSQRGRSLVFIILAEKIPKRGSPRCITWLDYSSVNEFKSLKK